MIEYFQSEAVTDNEGGMFPPAPDSSSSIRPASAGPRIGPAAEPGSVGTYETQGGNLPAAKGGSSSGAIIGGSIGGRL